ncbi:MAG: type IV secretion system protein [Candidatus Midichloria sp.]|nr:type IV secretion system protein [Candidatus Midichloria sp.]
MQHIIKKFQLFFIIMLPILMLNGRALAFDSMIEFESRSVTDSGFDYLGNIDNCFTSGKATWPWEYGAFNNTCIPTMLSKNKNSCKDGGVGGLALITNVGRGVVYAAMLTAVPFGTIFALLAMGIEYVIMIDLCTNAYIVAPHEYINFEQGWVQCEEKGANLVLNTHPNALTAVDVPFYYHCDPFYDPDTGTTLKSGVEEDEALIGRTWGYMGAASPYCAGDAAKYAKKDMVGKVVVHYVSGWDRFWSGLNRCKAGGKGSPKRQELILAAKKSDNDKYQLPAHYHAYYRFVSGVGKVQLCVVTPYTLLPIRIGCSYVPPPADDLDLDEFLKVYLQDTRCYYFITGRSDLNALGKSLQDTDELGIQKKYVKDFLSSDMHIISTVIGCMQDLLMKVFIETSGVNVNGQKPFFQIVQERLKQIVYAVLVLYVTLVGIKIITAAELPQRGELIMYVVKFGLVLYFATGNAWYEVKNGEKVGLYPALLSASSEIAGFFMGAQNDNDPIGFCQYQLEGFNLFGEREIPVSAAIQSSGTGDASSGYILNQALQPTMGFKDKVKITVWDLIDCKLLNYLNLGSCKYTIAGLIGVWMISAAILVSMQGFLLGVVSFIYCQMLLLVIFKFIHIFILSMFVLTILVLVSPIIICFALFDYTKSIFQKWMQLIIGYILYPALLFAFIALMLATFDSVFFGDIDLVNNRNDIKKACAGVDSVFCTTYEAVGADPCSANLGNINGTLTETLDLGPLGKFTILKDIFVGTYLDAVLKLMLFAFLFYLFLGSVSGFLAILTGVQDLGSMAKGSINIAAIMAAAGSGGAAGGASAAANESGGVKGGGEGGKEGGGGGKVREGISTAAGSGGGGGDGMPGGGS